MGRRKTHCRHGHELAEDNVIVRPDGRECRKCAYSRRNARYHRRKELIEKGELTVPQCSEDGCDRQTHAKGLCENHYRKTIRKARGGGQSPRICNVPDCESNVKARGLCGKHYCQARRRDPEKAEKIHAQERDRYYRDHKVSLAKKRRQVALRGKTGPKPELTDEALLPYMEPPVRKLKYATREEYLAARNERRRARYAEHPEKYRHGRTSRVVRTRRAEPAPPPPEYSVPGDTFEERMKHYRAKYDAAQKARTDG